MRTVGWRRARFSGDIVALVVRWMVGERGRIAGPTGSQPVARGEAATEAPGWPPRLDLLLVHGMGAQQRGGHLVQCGEPLCWWLKG